MEINTLVKRVKQIEMPEEMRERILVNCYSNTIENKENIIMKKKNQSIFRKPLVIAASLAVCICLTGVSALAASGKMEGIFIDITDWTGAITGEVYEQATDEIEVGISEVLENGEIEVLAKLVKADMVPYREFDFFGVEEYEILDADGKIIAEGATETVAIVEGQVKVAVPVAELEAGEYKLVIKAFVGEAKANQPLVVKGIWECSFTK